MGTEDEDEEEDEEEELCPPVLLAVEDEGTTLVGRAGMGTASVSKSEPTSNREVWRVSRSSPTPSPLSPTRDRASTGAKALSRGLMILMAAAAGESGAGGRQKVSLSPPGKFKLQEDTRW